MLLNSVSILLVMGCLLLPNAASPPADTEQQARKAIETAYTRQASAFAKKDLNGYCAPLADDYLGVDMSGARTNRDDFRHLADRLFELPMTLHSDWKITKFSITGTEAAVEITRHNQGIQKRPGSKTPTVAAQDLKAREIWTRSSHGWKLSRSKVLSSTTTSDGKVVTPAI